MRGILYNMAAAAAIASAVRCAADPLPARAGDLLLVGDSITAGLHFLELSAASARECWSGQLVRRLGIPPDSLQLKRPYPVDHLGLAQDGFGTGGLGYPWRALPVLLPDKDWIGDGDGRIVWAVPGQRAHELLVQSQQRHGDHSAGWTFGRRMLHDAPVIEAIERSGKRPRWVVLFIGANDLLASLGIVSGDPAPTPGAFAQTYAEIVRRLRACMPVDAPAAQLCVVTLPDVTRLPVFQPAPAGAVDAAGRPLEAGTKVSAFVMVHRKQFDDGEYWNAAALAHTEELAAAYNGQIRALATREGYTVVEIAALLEELRADPDFPALRSRYFSPDLHHPSYRTHAAIATRVLDAMAAAAGVAPRPTPDAPAAPLPSAGDLPPAQQARADALMFLAMRTLARTPIPPRPTARLAAHALAQAGSDRATDWGVAVEATLESPPMPVQAGWSSRGLLGVRTIVLSFDDRIPPAVPAAEHFWEQEQFEVFPARGVEFRAGMAFEPIGHWHWARLAGGIRAGLEGAPGVFMRAEWRRLYVDAAAHGWAPDQMEIGVRAAHPLRRHGRND